MLEYVRLDGYKTEKLKNNPIAATYLLALLSRKPCHLELKLNSFLPS
jgi:hypothetical protein